MSASGWGVDDYAAWHLLSDPNGPYAELLQISLDLECSLCLPPDCDLPPHDNIQEMRRIFKWHFLIPDPGLLDRFSCASIPNNRAGVERIHTVNSSRFSDDHFNSQQNILSQNNSVILSSSLLRDSTVDTPPMLRPFGDGWVTATQTAEDVLQYPLPRVIHSETLSLDRNQRSHASSSSGNASTVQVRIFLLDRSLPVPPRSASPSSVISSPLNNSTQHKGSLYLSRGNSQSSDDHTNIGKQYRDRCFKTFGKEGDCVHDAMDYLFALDSDDFGLLQNLNASVDRFRNTYEEIPGYEEELFHRADTICHREIERCLEHMTACNVRLSKIKSEYSVTLAVNSFIHSRFYQIIFSAFTTLHSADEEQFNQQTGLYRNSNPQRRLQVDFGVDQAIADHIDLSPVGQALDLLNVSTNPFDKLQCLSRAIKKIEKCVEQTSTFSGMTAADVSADVMFPLLSMSLASYPVKLLLTHFKYTQRFLPPCTLQGTEWEYTIVTFEAAIEYLTTLKFRSIDDTDDESDDSKSDIITCVTTSSDSSAKKGKVKQKKKLSRRAYSDSARSFDSGSDSDDYKPANIKKSNIVMKTHS